MHNLLRRFRACDEREDSVSLQRLERALRPLLGARLLAFDLVEAGTEPFQTLRLLLDHDGRWLVEVIAGPERTHHVRTVKLP